MWREALSHLISQHFSEMGAIIRIYEEVEVQRGKVTCRDKLNWWAMERGPEPTQTASRVCDLNHNPLGHKVCGNAVAHVGQEMKLLKLQAGRVEIDSLDNWRPS